RLIVRADNKKRFICIASVCSARPRLPGKAVWSYCRGAFVNLKRVERPAMTPQQQHVMLCRVMTDAPMNEMFQHLRRSLGPPPVCILCQRTLRGDEVTGCATSGATEIGLHDHLHIFARAGFFYFE